MSVLTFGNRLFNGKNGKFVLCGLSGPIKEMVDLAGFNTLLSIANTREEAEKLFRKD
jgi:anti-anti-sigma regulatory factor